MANRHVPLYFAVGATSSKAHLRSVREEAVAGSERDFIFSLGGKAEHPRGHSDSPSEASSSVQLYDRDITSL